MLEHGHSLIIKFTAGSGSASSSLWTGKDFLIHSCSWWENVKSSKVLIPNHSILISISTPAHICCLRYAVLHFTFAGVFHLQNCENRQYGAGTIIIVWTINVSFSKHFAQEEHCICLYFCTRPLCVYSTEGNLQAPLFTMQTAMRMMLRMVTMVMMMTWMRMVRTIHTRFLYRSIDHYGSSWIIIDLYGKLLEFFK